MQKGFGQYRGELVRKDMSMARPWEEGRHAVSKFRRDIVEKITGVSFHLSCVFKVYQVFSRKILCGA